jgi:hypothetical protein
MALLPPGQTTLLVITAPTNPIVPLFAARGIKQTLEPIRAAQSMRRTINGALDDLSMPQFRKYDSTVSFDDQRPLALDGIWPGQTVTVSCVAELSYLTAGGTPERPVVSGSSYTEGAFTFYRPILTMRVRPWQTDTGEYTASVRSKLELEEI